MERKRNAIEWAMHYRQIVILVVCCLIAFGIYSLPNMRKDEFPDFTIRQGLVVAVAPGNTVEESHFQREQPSTKLLVLPTVFRTFCKKIHEYFQ